MSSHDLPLQREDLPERGAIRVRHGRVRHAIEPVAAHKQMRVEEISPR